VRKLFILVVVALFAVIPAFAQDAEPTIADIVVSSSGAETPEFTVLLAAVQAADPGFLETLSDAEANVTVFAPTDAAFGALLESLDTTAEDLLANTDLLNTVLAYHVVPGTFNAEAVVGLDGSYLGTALRGEALAITLDGEAVKVNDSTVISADVAAANGIVHVIDAVLVPEMGEEMVESEGMADTMGTIADTVVASAGAETPEFTTLLAAVQAADPSVLDELTSGGPYTVFAPTDAAFAAALEALGLTAEELLADTETLNAVLAYHVVPGYFAAGRVVELAGMSEEGISVATLGGAPVTIMLNGETVMVNEANVVATDVVADNGIIHVIDAVLLPPM
jgi:transforming growth factor-beta-induced protein